jgi:hypothetical protein
MGAERERGRERGPATRASRRLRKRLSFRRLLLDVHAGAPGPPGSSS